MELDLNDILCNVTKKLEPEETLPDPSKLGERSPLGLYVSRSERKFVQTEEGEEIRCGICWGRRYEVDTGELIDAAMARNYLVIAKGTRWAEVHKAGVFRAAVGATTREAVILALAEALGVETEGEGDA